MQPEIKTLPKKSLIGKRITMSLAQNKTAELWKIFMPRRQEIKNVINSDLVSLQTYSPDYFKAFNPNNEFEKWALSEVSETNEIPNGMEVFSLEGDNFTQCYCPTNGQIGIKTNWLAAGSISKEDQNVLITQGWVYILDGAGWGLSNQPYLAKNTEFSCNGGGGGGTEGGGGGGTNGSSNGSGGTNGAGGGGDVLGISTLAGTNSPYSKYQILATILISSFFIAYGYKIQKNSK
jgi:hypothetical protein